MAEIGHAREVFQGYEARKRQVSQRTSFFRSRLFSPLAKGPGFERGLEGRPQGQGAPHPTENEHWDTGSSGTPETGTKSSLVQRYQHLKVSLFRSSDKTRPHSIDFTTYYVEPTSSNLRRWLPCNVKPAVLQPAYNCIHRAN